MGTVPWYLPLGGHVSDTSFGELDHSFILRIHDARHNLASEERHQQPL